MSVPKTKRSKSRLAIVTKSIQLATYTVQICSNEKHFPKRYRWCITSKIVENALEINKYILMANATKTGKTTLKDDLKIRCHYWSIAWSSTCSMLSLMEIAYNAFGIDGKRMEYWTGLVVQLQDLIKKHKHADQQRLAAIQK